MAAGGANKKGGQYNARRPHQFKMQINGVDDEGSDDIEDEVEELIEEEINTDRDANTETK